MSASLNVRTVVLTGANAMEVCAMPLILSEDRARVSVAAVGICGTDLHAYGGHHPFVKFPRVLGHEIAGTIVEVGSAVRGVAVGERVVVNPFTSCGKCRVCRRGFPNLCRELQVTGIHVDGGFAEYADISPRQLYRIPEGMDFDAAALVEPLSIGGEAISLGHIGAGDRVLIVGAGPIGLVCLAFAVVRGAETLVLDQIPNRLERAAQMGATHVYNVSDGNVDDFVQTHTDGYGAEVVIEAVGAKTTIESSFRWVAAGGTVVVLGIYNGKIEFMAGEWIRRGIRMAASRLNRNQFPDALEYLRTHPEIRSMITHKIGLDDLPRTMAGLASRELDACKVLVHPAVGNGS